MIELTHLPSKNTDLISSAYIKGEINFDELIEKIFASSKHPVSIIDFVSKYLNSIEITGKQREKIFKNIIKTQENGYSCNIIKFMLDNVKLKDSERKLLFKNILEMYIPYKLEDTLKLMESEDDLLTVIKHLKYNGQVGPVDYVGDRAESILMSKIFKEYINMDSESRKKAFKYMIKNRYIIICIIHCIYFSDEYNSEKLTFNEEEKKNIYKEYGKDMVDSAYGKIKKLQILHEFVNYLSYNDWEEYFDMLTKRNNLSKMRELLRDVGNIPEDIRSKLEALLIMKKLVG